MKISNFFITCLLFVATLAVVFAVPSRTLGPHVVYVDDTTVDYYIGNPRFVSHLYIYSHAYICVKCAQAGEIMSTIARDFNGQTYVLAMDASDQYNKATMERLGINPTTAQFPIVLEFPSESKPNGIEVPITTIDLAHMKKRVTDLVQLLSKVKQLDGKSMKKLLSFKTSPKPKAILLTTKDSVPTVWASLSSQFSHKYDFFMALKTDRKVIKRFDVDTFPTVLVLRKNEFNMDQKDDEIEPVIFTGQMKASIIKSFLSLYIPIDPTLLESTTPFSSYKALIDSTNQFVPVVSDEQCFSAYCSPENVSSSGLCLLFIPPTVFSPGDMTFTQYQEVAYQLEVIRGVKELRMDNQLTWTTIISQKLQNGENFEANEWFTGVFPSFFTSFNIQPQDYPQLVIYNPKKNAYANFLGAFSPDNINTWIGQILGGSSGLTPFDSDISYTTLEKSFPISTPSRCKYLFDKRAREIEDVKMVEEAKKKAQRQGKSQPTTKSPSVDVPEGTPESDVWVKPYRSLGKKGEVRKMTDELWKNVHLKRSVPILLQFYDKPATNFDSKTVHDVNTYRETIESFNGMVEGYSVECNDDTTHLRAIFGIEKCDGTILGIRSRASLTTIYDNYDEIETSLVGGHVVYEIKEEEVVSNTNTFTKDTLYKWASVVLFQGVKPYRLPDASDALQKWLLRSIKEPKVLIFTKKDDIILAKALALEFFNFAQVGLVGPEQHSLIDQFQVDSFPAVRIIIPRVQPHVGGTHGEMEMKLELIPIAKQHLYYNAIATHLDQVVSIRHHEQNTEHAEVFEPLHKEHPVETMVREHYEGKQKEQRGKRDEL